MPNERSTSRKLRLEASSATYEGEKYIANVNNVREVLERYGVAILPRLLLDTEIQHMNEGMWSTLEEMTADFAEGSSPIDRNAAETWTSIQKLKPTHGYMIRNWGIGHARYLWDLRGNSKVCDAFSSVHNTAVDQLVSSFDAVSVLLPEDKSGRTCTSSELWLHTDQRFNYALEPFRYSVQAWVTGFDVVEGCATLALLEGSHKHHAAFAERFGLMEHGEDWWQLQLEEHFNFLHLECQCPLRAVCCPAGSMVLFDSRLFHSGMGPPSGAQAVPRHVAYVCMAPRDRCSEADLCKRRDHFFQQRMTSHMPHVAQPKPYLPRGAEAAVRVRPPPTYSTEELTERMRTLIPLE